MQQVRNPRWIILVNCIPLTVLYFICAADYNVIHTLLSEESRLLWFKFGIGLILLAALNIGYALYLIIAKARVHKYYAFGALAVHITFLYFLALHFDEMIPWSIPSWMYSGNLFLYALTFITPTLAYALYLLVIFFTPEDNENQIWSNIAMIIIIPLLWFIFVMVLVPFIGGVAPVITHIMIVLLIATTVMFLFFLVRAAYIFSLRRKANSRAYSLYWNVLFTILLPLAGLSVHGGLFGDDVLKAFQNSFGDFRSAWFYGLAVINGVLLCVPSVHQRRYRTILFVLRSITFTYTFYFFIVFLPFLPFSIIAIIGVGVGFLMLTPIILFVIHLRSLLEDFKYLRSTIRPSFLIAIFVVGALIIPLTITGINLYYRVQLTQTLSYLYTPDYTKQYEIDSKAVKHVLERIESSKGNNYIFGVNQPYLTPFFNWLVLDNLTLSASKLDDIEHVFFNKSKKQKTSQNSLPTVAISDIATRSTYDSTKKSWVSWIDLSLTNSANLNFAEFRTEFDLPAGTYISNYYLYVGDRKEFGLLAKKKAALWVYSNIRNENRDPGILYYLEPDKIAFHVFPFGASEVRKTGIEFTHKEPITIQLEGRKIILGKPDQIPLPIYEMPNVAYISAFQKAGLPKVTRLPYYHFIVDLSSTGTPLNYQKQIEVVLQQNPKLGKNAKISLTNTFVRTVPVDDNWKKNLHDQQCTGGFNAEWAIRAGLVNAYLTANGQYPVFVIIKGNTELPDIALGDMEFLFPESRNYYVLDGTTENVYSLSDSEVKPAIVQALKEFVSTPVLEYQFANGKKAYVRDIAEASIAYSLTQQIEMETVVTKEWKSGLQMQAHFVSDIMFPAQSERRWVQMIRNSIKTGLMSPYTSYLVVENDAQKAALLLKQKQILSGNKSLDPDEDVQRMSEPGMIVILFLGMLIYLRKKYYLQIAQTNSQ